ncbi:Uncharacterized protein FKW44_011827, partial [Caligus rogercresseyi]
IIASFLVVYGFVLIESPYRFIHSSSAKANHTSLPSNNFTSEETFTLRESIIRTFRIKEC